MLVDEGHTVDCACKITGEYEIKRDKLKESINFFDIPVTRNPLNFKNIISLYKLYKIQKESKYDVIHVHFPIIGAYMRLIKIVFPEVKMIYTDHGYHFHKRASKLTWLIFYNVENLEIRKSIGLNKDDFVLIIVGAHNKNKNQIQLIKTIQKLEKSYPKIKAMFIGDGKLIEENKEYIKKNNIKNAIVLGFRRDVNELINISNVLCWLSFREGLPKNVIEGMACKKVIIGTKTRGIEELIEYKKMEY